MERVRKLTAQLTAASGEQQQEDGEDYNILQGAPGYASPEMGKGVSLRGSVSEAEWKLRCDLAAAYRIVAMNGWDDSINNHVSVRVGEHFLINPMGLGFEEITASSLVLINKDGDVVKAGSCGTAVNKAGFVIHSALHMAEGRDYHCVAHTHEANVTAVSCDPDGLLPINQTALLCGKLSMHDFEGVAVSTDERERLVNDMHEDSTIMLLRNHGVVTVGANIAQCMTRLYYIHKAAEIQVKVRMSGSKINPVDTEVVDLVQNYQTLASPHMGEAMNPYFVATFDHMKRRLATFNPGWDL